MDRRIFYVVYVTGEVLGDCFDAIRLLARPEEKCHSHITLRGPYSRHLGNQRLMRRALGAAIDITGAGNFFAAGQTTVYLTCKAPELRDVWYKPDFPEFNPHLTLYDGPSRQFGKNLLAVVSKYRLAIRFSAAELRPFVSVNGQSYLADQVRFDEAELSAFIGQRVTRASVLSMSEEERLAVIDAILARLEESSDKVRQDDWSRISWKALASRVTTT